MRYQITRCKGEGQGACKRCLQTNGFSRVWMSMLFEIEGVEGKYCIDCTHEILKEMGDDEFK